MPSFVSCRQCWHCQQNLFSLCDNTHPKPEPQEPLPGHPTAGIYGSTHAFGGYAGAHARYGRTGPPSKICQDRQDVCFGASPLRRRPALLPNPSRRRQQHP